MAKVGVVNGRKYYNTSKTPSIHLLFVNLSRGSGWLPLNGLFSDSICDLSDGLFGESQGEALGPYIYDTLLNLKGKSCHRELLKVQILCPCNVTWYISQHFTIQNLSELTAWNCPLLDIPAGQRELKHVGTMLYKKYNEFWKKNKKVHLFVIYFLYFLISFNWQILFSVLIKSRF